MKWENRQKLKKLLKGYRRINGEMIRFFESVGFTVSLSGSHCKLTCAGGCVILAKTPSDHRSGLNAYALILKVCGERKAA